MRLASTVSKGALLAGLAAAALGGASLVARADTQAIDVTTVGTYPPLTNNGFNYFQQPGGYTFSWDFTANSPIQVTQLGYYNADLTGAANPNGFGTHLVSLIDVSTDTTIAAARVNTDSPVTGVFNYAGIDPVQLNTTDTYEVSGMMTTQFYLVGLNQAAAPLAPQINYQFGPQDIFGTPGPPGTYDDFGPNFQFTANSTCTENVPGRDVIALTGDVCTAAPGVYNPTITGATLPVTYDGFGFYAHGGTINSPGAITINTTDPNDSGGSYGIWADTTGSQINLNGTSSITTTSDQSHGVYASGGGQISSTGALSVATNGQGANGLYASGTGSSITATLGVISTTGAFASGAQADNGGALTLTGGSITTSGGGAFGMYATNAGSEIVASGTNVSTTGGNFANALYATGGGTITLNGGSAQTSGNSVYAVSITPGGTINLNGTTVTATGLGSGGIGLNGSTAAFTGSGLTIVTQGDPDPNTGFGAAGLTNQGYGEASGGGNATLMDSSISTSGASAQGVNTANGGTTTIFAGAITTSGANSAGVQNSSGASTTIGLDEGGIGATISTTGASSPGVLANGGSVTLTGANVSTTGANSIGLYATGAGSSISATNSSISTAAALTPAVQADQGGAVTLTGGTVSTSGNGAWGLFTNGAGSTLSATGTTVNTTGGVDPSGNVSLGAYAQQGSAMTLTNTTILTSGAAAHGAEAGNASSIAFSGGSVTTTGANAYGLFSTDTGSSITASNGVTIATTGLESDGVFALNGASATLQGGSVTTAGLGAAALFASGAGANLTATGVTVSTTGGFDPATGNQSQGATAVNSATMTLTNDAITTSGEQGQGVLAATGGTVTISGGSVTVSGVDTDGLLANGVGSVITTSGGLVVTSTATTSMHTIEGARADAGGLLNLSQTTITTTGTSVSGIGVETGATANLNGVTVTTSGDAAHAITATGAGSTVTLAGTNSLTTTGNGAIGIFAGTGGAVTGTGSVSISTAGTNALTNGLSSFGVNADGAGSSVTLASATIRTAGQGAVGVLASDLNESGSGGVITVNGALNITTQSAFAYDVYAGALGARIALNGATTLNVGAGSFGLYATGGGVITTAGNLSMTAANAGFGGGVEANTGSSITLGGTSTINLTSTDLAGLFAAGGTITANAGLTVNAGDNLGVIAQGGTITLAGPTVVNTTGSQNVGVYAVEGGTILANGSLTVNSSEYGVYVYGAAGESAGGASISVAGTMALTTTTAGGAALDLYGDGATFSGTGGGTITSAGIAIALINGVDQVATFDNYTINSVSGDLIYADPSTSTVNFNNTTANAGTGNLVDATNSSNVTLNANASTLTGAIATDETSTTNVNLANRTTWNLTGNSNVSNLSVNNSAIVFAPSTTGGFKTLTVGSYTGTGASITLNALLSGANPGADQIVINGGQAKGTTTINIKSLGTIGAPTSGLGVPIVTTTNGGSIAPGAFALASPVVVGGFQYTLESEDGGEFLVSQAGLTSAQANSSLASLAQSKESQTITNRILGSILTGATEQMNCSSCSSGFASFGSFAVGVHGRWTLSPNVELLAGGSYDSYSAKGVTVNNSMDVAAALRYDAVQLGRYRPFFEAGIGASPYAEVNFQRNYSTAAGGSSGGGTTLSQAVAAYGRTGYIFRLSRIDEAAVYTDVTRSWQHTDGYQEASAVGNPFGATVAPSLDTLNIWKIGGQYTHLFGEHIEANISAGYALAFGADYGASAVISGFGAAAGTAPSTFGWAELGGRLSYRLSQKLTADAFVLGTVGAEPAGSQVHGGLALRFDF